MKDDVHNDEGMIAADSEIKIDSAFDFLCFLILRFLFDLFFYIINKNIDLKIKLEFQLQILILILARLLFYL